MHSCHCPMCLLRHIKMLPIRACPHLNLKCRGGMRIPKNESRKKLLPKKVLVRTMRHSIKPKAATNANNASDCKLLLKRTTKIIPQTNLSFAKLKMPGQIWQTLLRQISCRKNKSEDSSAVKTRAIHFKNLGGCLL